MKWDDYLIDIQNAVEQSSHENVAAADNQTSRVVHTINGLSSHLDELRSELNMGFGLLVERLDLQNELMDMVVAELQDIHRTLRSPLMTRADELLRIGRQHIRRGLYDKALNALLASEELYDVNCVLQLNLGLIYLYGQNEDRKLIDFDKAEKHFLAAAKYAKAMEYELAGAVYFYEQGYLQAATVTYLRSSEAAKADRHNDAQVFLKKALEYCAKEPYFRDRAYFKAKCLSLTGDAQGALKELSWLIDHWREYLPKAIADPDFISIKDKVASLRNAEGRTTKEARNILDTAHSAIQRAKEIDTLHKFSSEIAALQFRLQEQQKALKSDTGIVEQVKTAGNEIQRDSRQLARRIVADRISVLQHAKSPLSSRLSEAESALDKANRQKMEFGAVFFASWIGGFIIFTMFGCGVNLLRGIRAEDGAFYAAMPTAFSCSFIFALIFALFRLPAVITFYEMKKRTVEKQVAAPINQLDKRIQELRELE